MGEDQSITKSRASKKWWWVALGIFCALVLAALTLPIFSSVAKRSPVMGCLSKAKTIGLACKLYAGDNDGRYPATLNELVPDYLSDEKGLRSPFEPMGPAYGFRYFGGTENDPPDTVLLLGKAPRGYWIVILSDISGTASRDPKWADYAPPKNPKSKF